MYEIWISYVFDISELSLQFPWDYEKIDMLETVWDMPDMCILDWDLPEACLIYVRDILEISLRNVWHMRYAFEMSELCLRYD